MIDEEFDAFVNTDFEAVVLASIFFYGEQINDRAVNPFHLLSSNNFWHKEHQVLFTLFVQLQQDALPYWDDTFLMQKINEQALHISQETVANIIMTNPVANLQPYIDLLIRLTQYREIRMMLVNGMRALSEQSRDSPESILFRLQEDFHKVESNNHVTDIITAGELVESSLENSETLSTNYLFLDRILDGGINTGTFNIVTGPPESGKSHFTYSLLERISNNHFVGLISLEFAHKMEQDRLKQMLAANIEMNIDQILLNFSYYDLSQIITLMYKWKRLYDCRIVVIDSLNRITVNNISFQSVTERINHIADSLERTAKLTNIVLMVIAEGSKDDYKNSTAGVAYSAHVSHLAWIHWDFKKNDEGHVLRWIKNKQNKVLCSHELIFKKDGSIYESLDNASIFNDVKPI